MEDEKQARIRELEELIKTLRSQLPAHSVKPEMLIKLEELEDELEALREKRDKG